MPTASTNLTIYKVINVATIDRNVKMLQQCAKNNVTKVWKPWFLCFSDPHFICTFHASFHVGGRFYRLPYVGGTTTLTS